MGLMGAIGAGLAEAGGAAAGIGFAQVKAAIEADRDARLSDMRLAEDAIHRQRSVEGADAERTKRSTDINEGARLIASGRNVVPSDISAQADTNARTINDAATAGQITPEVATQALAGTSDYANMNAKPDTVVTQADRDQAAIEKGYITPNDAASIQHRKEQDRIAEKKGDQKFEYEQQRNDRLDTLAEKRAKAEGDRATAGDAKELRAATSKALDGVNADIKALEKEVSDPMMPPEKKAVVDRQLVQARQEAAGYRKALANAGLPVSTEPATPKGKTGWDSASGDVYVNGEKVGSAKDEAAARALAKTGKPASAPAAGGAPKGAPSTPSAAPAAADTAPIKMEPAGKTAIMGGKQFVATYADGTKKVISGDEAERQYILLQK